jgi:hypothetical protein
MDCCKKIVVAAILLEKIEPSQGWLNGCVLISDSGFLDHLVCKERTAEKRDAPFWSASHIFPHMPSLDQVTGSASAG